jgi:hypothetical protein
MLCFPDGREMLDTPVLFPRCVAAEQAVFCIGSCAQGYLGNINGQLQKLTFTVHRIEQIPPL